MIAIQANNDRRNCSFCYPVGEGQKRLLAAAWLEVKPVSHNKLVKQATPEKHIC